MPDVLKDPVVSQTLESEWSSSTTYRRREIAEAILDFIRNHPNSSQFVYWDGMAVRGKPSV